MQSQLSLRREKLALILICVIAVGLRLIRLGALSFAGDEETTTLAALALLEGWPPTLPGGLVYLRGLPFTFLEAIAVWIAGVDEFAMRLVPAVAAGPRIAAAWWLARPYLGGPAALAVAAVLAVTPLDIEMSRNARMYSLFATFDLVFVAGVVHLCLGRRGGAGIGVVGSLSSVTHALGVMHAPLPVLAAISRGITRDRVIRLLLAAALALGGYAVTRRLDQFSYGSTGMVDASALHLTPIALHWQRLGEATASTAATIIAVVGALFAITATIAACRRLRRPIARLACVAAGAAWVLASPVLGFSLLLGVMVLDGVTVTALLSGRRPLLYAGLAGTFGWGIASVYSSGSIESTARLLLGFPAPNWLEFASAAPIFFGLAIVGAIVAADRGARSSKSAIWLVLIAAALAPALIGGMARRAEAMRFQIHALAPLLILAFLAAHAGAARLLQHKKLALAAAMAILFIAVRPDQSVHALLREHGPVAEPFAVLNVAPDHRGAGKYLREHAAPDEWIVAEDPLQQYLYAGRSEIWLRRNEDAARYLYPAADGQRPRDVYTGSRQVGDLDELSALAKAEGKHVIWLVTSGEVEGDPSFYRTPATDATLTRWQPRASFVGADGLTRVYRLVDGEPR